ASDAFKGRWYLFLAKKRASTALSLSSSRSTALGGSDRKYVAISWASERQSPSEKRSGLSDILKYWLISLVPCDVYAMARAYLSSPTFDKAARQKPQVSCVAFTYKTRRSLSSSCVRSSTIPSKDKMT